MARVMWQRVGRLRRLHRRSARGRARHRDANRDHRCGVNDSAACLGSALDPTASVKSSVRDPVRLWRCWRRVAVTKAGTSSDGRPPSGDTVSEGCASAMLCLTNAETTATAQQGWRISDRSER